MKQLMASAVMPELTARYKFICPYCNLKAAVCEATFSTMSIDRQLRAKYCLNEDYSNCAIFLAKILIKA